MKIFKWVILKKSDHLKMLVELEELYKQLLRPLSEPKPLTLDELRKMSGKPVWITNNTSGYGHWEIFDITEIVEVEYCIGQGFKYYDREPRKYSKND